MSDYAEKKCASCPTIFKPGGPRAKYCDECTSRPRVAAGTKKTKRRLALVAASKKLPTRVTEVFSDAPSSPMDRARNFFVGMNLKGSLKLRCRSCWLLGKTLDADRLCSPACRSPKGRELAERLDWIERHGATDQGAFGLRPVAARGATAW